MICSPCTQCNDIYLCSDTLTIGDVDAAGTYNAVIQNNTTGRIIIVAVVMAEAGAVEVSMDYFAKDHNYSVSLQQNHTNVLFNIGEEEVSCVDFIVRSAVSGAEADQELTVKA